MTPRQHALCNECHRQRENLVWYFRYHDHPLHEQQRLFAVIHRRLDQIMLRGF